MSLVFLIKENNLLLSISATSDIKYNELKNGMLKYLYKLGKVFGPPVLLGGAPLFQRVA